MKNWVSITVLGLFFTSSLNASPNLSAIKTIVETYLAQTFNSEQERESRALLITKFLENTSMDNHKEFLLELEFGLAGDFYQMSFEYPQGRANLNALLNVIFKRHEISAASERARMPGVFEAVEYSAVFLIGGAVAWALGFHLIGATFASASLQGVGLVIIERGRENSRIRRARQDFARRVYKMRGDYCRNSLARVAL